jgi:N,N'-diacetyllegionaminate synthase
MNKKTLIIAEAGVNHNGSMELAIELIDVAAQSGADYVKFQTFKTDLLVTSSAEMAGYQKKIIVSGESQAEMLKKLELSQDSFAILAKYADKKGIGFLSTPFDVESAVTLNNIGMDFYKISSGDLTNTPFLRQIAKFCKPIILSTGMANLGEVEGAIATLEAESISMKDITILHCTTEYPAPIDEVNLRAINTLESAFPGAVIGYSDHTDGIDISIAAVALGARVIEKHFTLNKKMLGPDHQASLEPNELLEMVRSIRRVDNAMGNGRKIPTRSESQNIKIARKSIVAATDIAMGTLLSPQNITVRRPGDGISPNQWDDIVGTVAKKDYKRDEKIEF